jgi:hypothetical protein
MGVRGLQSHTTRLLPWQNCSQNRSLRQPLELHLAEPDGVAFGLQRDRAAGKWWYVPRLAVGV